MNGDNFRPVDAATAAWAMKQHLDMVAADIGLRMPPPPPEPEHRVPSRVAEILRTIIKERGISAQAFLHGQATKRVYQARQAAYQALRDMPWADGVPSYSQIGRWCNRHPSSVHHYFDKVAPLEAKGGAA